MFDGSQSIHSLGANSSCCRREFLIQLIDAESRKISRGLFDLLCTCCREVPDKNQFANHESKEPDEAVGTEDGSEKTQDQLQAVSQTRIIHERGGRAFTRETNNQYRDRKPQHKLLNPASPKPTTPRTAIAWFW